MTFSKIVFLLPIFLLTSGCNETGSDAARKQQNAEQELTNARIEAQKKVENAQTTADEKIQQADVQFQRTVADYRATCRKQLADIEKDISDLSLKVNTFNGQKRDDALAAITTARAQKDAYVSLVQALDKSTPTTFDAMKSNTDKVYDDIRATLRKAP